VRHIYELEGAFADELALLQPTAGYMRLVKTGIEPVSVDYREKVAHGEETRPAGWSAEIVPGLCPNGRLPSTNTVTYGETPRETSPELFR
jgi:hypothetical protein